MTRQNHRCGNICKNQSGRELWPKPARDCQNKSFSHNTVTWTARKNKVKVTGLHLKWLSTFF